MNVHSTAIVESGAVLAEDVVVGAYAYIGSRVKLGQGTVVHHHASIEGETIIGDNNQIYPYVFLGGLTQDLKYKGSHVGLKIGNNNIFREYMTVHSGTEEGRFTEIGDQNAFLAYCHVAHDCKIGNHVIMSSLAALGGYVRVEDYANIGWNAGVHQFCRVGKYAMVAASAKAIMDVLPFMIVDGNPARTRAFNKVNLERNHFSQEDIENIKNVYRIIFHSEGNRSESLKKLKVLSGNYGNYVAEFIEHSERGFS